MSSLALSCPALHHNIPQLPVQVSYCVEHLSSVIDSDSCRIGLVHSETSGNLDIYRSVDLWIVWDGFPSAFASAHTGSSEISQGIFFRMSAFGVQSLSTSIDIFDDIASPRGNAYSRYSSRKVASRFHLECPVCRCQYSSAWRVSEDLV